LNEKNNKWLKVPSIPMGLLFNKKFFDLTKLSIFL
jgi:hypothetical protein